MVDTWERGKTHTQHFVDNYKRLVPESTGIEHNDDKPGDVNDMLDGIDCTLIFGDKRRTLQVKGVTKCELRDDGVYYINVSMVLEKYRNIGILITDHNVDETLSITDRAYLLFEGKILKAGTPKELADDEQVRRLYLGKNFKLKENQR